nr:PaaI family thioesterase [uncultured Caproiciproducens sp.]
MDIEKLIEFNGKKNEFMIYNGIRIKSAKKDCVEVSLQIGPHSLNTYGLLHGGAYYTMADCAAGAAAKSDGGHYVTLSGGLNYIKSVSEGTVTAKGSVIHRGRTTCILHVDITDEKDALLAEGDFTMFCIEQPQTEEEAKTGTDTVD